MLKNHLKIALRSLRKQSFYAILNVVGLAVGVACCLLITLFVIDELSFDKHFDDSDRLHRIVIDLKFGEMDGRQTHTPAPLAKTLVERFPEVEAAARFRSWGSRLIRRNEKMDNINEEQVIWADAEIFDLFSFNVVSGDPIESMREPQTMVITQSIAEKYFPGEDAQGQTLMIDNNVEKPYKVVAVVDDLPANSHFGFQIFLSMEGLGESKDAVWLSHNFMTYLKLKPDADIAALEAKFPEMLSSLAGPQLQQFMGITIEEFQGQGNRINYHAQPLSEIYLHSSDIDSGSEIRSGDINYVYIFGIIALFILAIACINFMNLATARSAMRAKEVGIRKVLGSFRRQLIQQFLVESILLSVISVLLALLMAEVLMPVFNSLSGKSLVIPFSSFAFIGLMVIVSGLVGALAGIYPAFFLSGFQPVQVLKGKLFSREKSGWLRSSLVVFQFVASIFLIIGTVVVYQQLQFVQQKKLGYNKDQVVTLHDTYVLDKKVQAFKQELLSMSEIKHATVSGYLPVSSSRNNSAFWPTGNRTQERTVVMENWQVDHDYVATMKMEIIAGRDFSINFPTDSQAVILNESAIRQFALIGDPLGQKVSDFSELDPETGEASTKDYTIVGIVKDFHYESLKENIGALGLFVGNSNGSISCRVDPANMEATLAEIEAKWSEFAPGQPFSYSFLDEQFTKLYGNEQRQGNIFAAFSFLAILVACLGLLGLASFTAERRAKEIGIRKVLGATVSHIVVMLSREFAWLVLIAFVIASVGGYFAMDYWLDDFAYRITMGPGIFLMAGFTALGIALLTVSYQSIRAAIADPIHSLRDE